MECSGVSLSLYEICMAQHVYSMCLKPLVEENLRFYGLEGQNTGRSASLKRAEMHTPETLCRKAVCFKVEGIQKIVVQTG